MNDKFNIVLSDPPWQFRDKNTGGSFKSGSANQYRVMDIDRICNIPVQDICADDCILFLWWVASQPYEALKVVESWGFKIKTMTGFNWIKTTKKGKLHFGMGHYTRACSESCLIATRGKPQIINHSIRSVVIAPNLKHSHKPDIVAENIVQMCGDVPRIELFARYTEKLENGWVKVGDQVDGHDIEESIRMIKEGTYL